jgi:hypothetical protein
MSDAVVLASSSSSPLFSSTTSSLPTGSQPTTEKKRLQFEFSVEGKLIGNGPRWERKSFVGTAPTPRSGHSLNVINQGTSLVLFGGHGKTQLCSDMFFLDGSTFQTISLLPIDRLEKRIGHSSVTLGQNNVYIFGGWNSHKYLNYGCLLDVEEVSLPFFSSLSSCPSFLSFLFSLLVSFRLHPFVF